MDPSTTPPHQLHLHFPHQEMGSRSDSQSLENMIPNPTQNQNQEQQQDQKKPRPPDGEPQKCPRCDSTNTKFCYYNNYSLTQPRYFCKACRRYWTKGGTLRNVPVGGGCRKSSKRSSAASSPSLSPSHFLKRPHNRETIIPAMVTAANPHFPNFNSYNNGLLGLGFEGVDQDLPMSTRALFGHQDGMGGFLQELQHGNGGGGLMFQNLCSYEEAGGGNNNCVSGISEDMAAASMAPYEEVKHERGENGALWGLPWQMINGENGSLMGDGDLEAIRENSWNGLIGNPTWGLLNTTALM